MSIVELRVEGIEPALSVRHFAIRENVSELFSVSVVACSPRPDLDLDEALFKPAVFSMAAGWVGVADSGSREYTGLCESIEQLQAEPSGLSTYSLHLAPRLWLLTLRRNYRIFQHVSIPEIATRILDEFSVVHRWRVDRAAHPKLDYKVQYGESDFAFLCRLCEEAGLTFTFQSDEERASVLVISDAPCAREPRGASLPYVDNPSEAAEREFVTRVRQFRKGRPSGVALRDFDFRNPSLALFTQTPTASMADSPLLQYRYEPGAFRVVMDAQSSTPIADKLGVARHEPIYGQSRAERLLLGDRAAALGVSFESNALDLAPGVVFSIAGHPHPKLDEAQQLLMTHFELEGDHDKEWRMRGKAVLADQPYKPPRTMEKAVVHGLQSALITGPEGRDIFTDEHGRVRVKFPWDRYGDNNEQSSCWIRVSQGWAGAGFGLHALPRVGQEVLVGFLAGDPDEPIIVGRAPNAHNPPPYPLPANETMTVWRSQSTPGANGFNEISFEDKKGDERFYERAEKDKESLVRNDEQLAVGRNRAKLVKGDENSVILRARRELIGGNDHRTVNGDQHERVKGSKSLIIDGDWHIRVAGRLLLEAGGEIHLVSETKIVETAPDLTMNAGGFVHASGAGVEIDGPAVLIEAGGAPSCGADSRPIPPELPGIAKNFIAQPGGLLLRRLPMFPIGPTSPTPLSGPDYERQVICRAVCMCDGANNGNQRASQWCVSISLWDYDRAFAYQSTIKAEVPFDMSKKPPQPTMSRNDPRRTTHGRPDGSVIPDVIVLHDGKKPVMAGNIKTIYEIKFGGEREDRVQLKTYRKIDKSADVKLLRPDDCGCNEDDPDKLPHPITAKEAAAIVLLALLALLLIYDGIPGDEVPVLVPLRRLLPRLAPTLRRLLSKWQPVSPMLIPR